MLGMNERNFASEEIVNWELKGDVVSNEFAIAFFEGGSLVFIIYIFDDCHCSPPPKTSP